MNINQYSVTSCIITVHFSLPLTIHLVGLQLVSLCQPLLFSSFLKKTWSLIIFCREKPLTSVKLMFLSMYYVNNTQLENTFLPSAVCLVYLWNSNMYRERECNSPLSVPFIAFKLQGLYW